MQKNSVILTNLVHALTRRKTILYTNVFSTFLAIPEFLLNSHQKLVCIGFMVLCEASNIVKDAQIQIGIPDLGKLCGLSRYQAQRALSGLSQALENVMANGILGTDESIKFQIKDVNGNVIKKNKTGIASFYEFEYCNPRLKKRVGIEVHQTEIKTNPNSEPYDKSKDIYYELKIKELQRMKEYFSDAELSVFLPYPLERIGYVTDYFLKQRKDKVLSHGWLKKAFKDFEIHPDKQRERIIRELEFLRNIHKRVLELVDEKKIYFEHLKIFVNGHEPKYHHIGFREDCALQDMFFENIEKLNYNETQELEASVHEVYNLLKDKFASVGLYNFKDAEIHIKHAIVNKHFNLI